MRPVRGTQNFKNKCESTMCRTNSAQKLGGGKTQRYGESILVSGRVQIFQT